MQTEHIQCEIAVSHIVIVIAVAVTNNNILVFSFFPESASMVLSSYFGSPSPPHSYCSWSFWKQDEQSIWWSKREEVAPEIQVRGSRNVIGWVAGTQDTMTPQASQYYPHTCTDTPFPCMHSPHLGNSSIWSCLATRVDSRGHFVALQRKR